VNPALMRLQPADDIAWLFREAGLVKESDELYRQVQLLQSVGDSKVGDKASSSRAKLIIRPRKATSLESWLSMMLSTISSPTSSCPP
jgi:hypothetical protein